MLRITSPRFPTLVLACICIISISSSNAEETSPPGLPLVDAINHALRFNRSVMLAELTADEAQISVNEAYAAFRIRWGLEGRAGTTAEDETLAYGVQTTRKFGWGGEAGIRAGYQTGDENEGAYLQFDLSQPLFRNAGSLLNKEPIVQAEQSAIDARRSLYLRKMDLMIDVVRGYEAVLRYERQVEMDRRALKRLDDLLTLTRAREETGGATRLDSLRVDLQRGEAETTLENSIELLALERDDFFNLIGWTQHMEIAFTPAPLLDVPTPVLADALATALSNRLDYARALDQLDTAERQILIARKNMQPNLIASGNYRMEGGQEGSDATDLEEASWFAGVSVEPDLNRYEKRAGLLRSESQREQVLINLTDLDYTIERDIKQQIRAYHRAIANYRIATRNTGLAWKRLELAESMFRMGQGDNFSVTDAESAHTSAVSTELAARAEASLSGYRLLNALGSLLDVPDELKPRR